MSAEASGTGTSQGDRANRAIHEAATRLEEQTEQFVRYLNDEVIPAVRQHSSRGLRIAAEKLNQFAEYMEEQGGRKPPPNGK